MLTELLFESLTAQQCNVYLRKKDNDHVVREIHTTNRMRYHHQPQHWVVLKTQEIIHWSQIRPSLLFSWGCWWRQSLGPALTLECWAEQPSGGEGKSEGNEQQQMEKSPALHDTALEGGILAQDRALTAELSPPIQTNLSLALLPY